MPKRNLLFCCMIDYDYLHKPKNMNILYAFIQMVPLKQTFVRKKLLCQLCNKNNSLERKCRYLMVHLGFSTYFLYFGMLHLL